MSPPVAETRALCQIALQGPRRLTGSSAAWELYADGAAFTPGRWVARVGQSRGHSSLAGAAMLGEVSLASAVYSCAVLEPAEVAIQKQKLNQKPLKSILPSVVKAAWEAPARCENVKKHATRAGAKFRLGCSSDSGDTFDYVIAGTHQGRVVPGHHARDQLFDRYYDVVKASSGALRVGCLDSVFRVGARSRGTRKRTSTFDDASPDELFLDEEGESGCQVGAEQLPELMPTPPQPWDESWESVLNTKLDNDQATFAADCSPKPWLPSLMHVGVPGDFSDNEDEIEGLDRCKR
eukprot:CAMPEP_0115748052 /NCGR_PEP_ID=MMETSP0272-20121206/93476_1 /TAXON_ID=71861 /ORGANISM="Scrippsiella trochoidea, Strain CCMP3099" /LENGTH=292 /DNA_ID=CAMNT_0003193057 /DNA_START=58 /DNA_END=937 /DNA_ORIENTATION=-